MRPSSWPPSMNTRRFPRVSGDAPYADIVAMLLDVFSPRERGCAREPGAHTRCHSVFPA